MQIAAKYVSLGMKGLTIDAVDREAFAVSHWKESK